MLNFDSKPYIYLCLQINCNTLGVNIGLFGIIYVSLSSKARQSNTQNHCISTLMLQIFSIYRAILRLLQMCCYKRHTRVFIVFHVNLKVDFAY